ncbi:nucleotidyltransferase family protein [Microbulbifer taiwanensis]|uniref:nucleotidyltransferase family protein n=1 Tax=Microbulbifer taiwanensis TaxID=986746 RepID=UPI003620C796
MRFRPGPLAAAAAARRLSRSPADGAQSATQSRGDFGIDSGLLSGTAKPRYTFAGISWLRPQVLTEYPHVRDCFGLGEVFTYNEDKMQAELYEGDWCDVGTPERLERLDTRLAEGKVNK